ncbi:MAG TPA: hypothetical protein VFA90_00540 [Terriglobales bacterium]|nr:hypothetical protein [Terriglobales bacterium]
MSTNLPLGIFAPASRSCAKLNHEHLPAGSSNEPEDGDVPESTEESYFTSSASGRNPDLWLYRERTIGLLKRYLRLSIEVGRLPSLLGRELFRSKVTSYRMATFEDAVIFVHDVERILDQLDTFSKDMIAVIIFQDYSQEAAAAVLGCGRRTLCRQFPETIDAISESFLEGGLLNQLPLSRPVENSCQEGERARFAASDCKQAE